MIDIEKKNITLTFFTSLLSSTCDTAYVPPMSPFVINILKFNSMPTGMMAMMMIIIIIIT